MKKRGRHKRRSRVARNWSFQVARAENLGHSRTKLEIDCHPQRRSRLYPCCGPIALTETPTPTSRSELSDRSVVGLRSPRHIERQRLPGIKPRMASRATFQKIRRKAKPNVATLEFAILKPVSSCALSSQGIRQLREDVLSSIGNLYRG